MSDAPPPVFRYSLNKGFRNLLLWIARWVTVSPPPSAPDLRQQSISKILIVRATFRLGDSLLALPAVWSFRKHFPQARIDFVGAPVSKILLKNLPLDNHFSITRRYPGSAFDYPLLLRQLRRNHYDLAVDVSCSQSAMGSFLVGLSGARLRAGMTGKWDRWFNIKGTKSADVNKYKTLQRFLNTLEIAYEAPLAALALSDNEREEGKKKIAALIKGSSASRTVGVFVGGRKTWGKRWPTANFCELITALHAYGLNVVAFVGPEEKDGLGYFRDALDKRIPIVFEPSLRIFAAMLSNCELFVTCDSGPMHLGYSLDIPTVAIFQYSNFDRWAPPVGVRVVHEPAGCSPDLVFRACCEELSIEFDQNKNSAEPLQSVPALRSIPAVNEARERLESATRLARLLKIERALRFTFAILLVIYALFMREGVLTEGTFMEQFVDVLGALAIIAGGLLHVWGLSHNPLAAQSDPAIRRELFKTGPYACGRHPLWIANLLMGVGMILILDAYVFGFLLLMSSIFYHRIIIPAEELFLTKCFGENFEKYCRSTPKYLPRVFPKGNFFLGRRVRFREIGPILALILVVFFFESIESPQNRPFIITLYHWLTLR